MSDDVLTADQLNYAGQPLINLVIDLQHNILNVANGLWNRGYRDYPLDNIISILDTSHWNIYRNELNGFSNADLIRTRDKHVQMLITLRNIGEQPDPILSIKENIRSDIGLINLYKGQIISNGDEYKINKLNQVLSHYPDEQFEHEMNIDRLITIRTQSADALIEILHIMVDPVPVGGSINRKTKGRKTKRRKTKRRKTKRRKTKGRKTKRI